MTRVALLPSAYLPTLGGVQELSRHLALALTDAGDAVEIWTMQSDLVDHPTVELLDGLRVRYFPFPLFGARPQSVPPFLRGAPKSMRALRQAVRAFRPDLLHVQCFGPNGVYATAIARLAGLPLMVTLQGETLMDDQDIFEHSTIMRTALRVALRQAVATTACSAFTLGDAEARFGLKTGRGEVIFNGVVTEGESHERGMAALGRFILAVGRVVEKKGFDLLLRGFAEVAEHHQEVHLAIGGDGPALPGLERLAEELGIAPRVRFLGRLSRTEVAAMMESAELFVMPSRLEPFGIVVLESWRAGTPVVCTSRGGPPEFVDDGRTGLLVDPFDTAALAGALDRILGDRSLRTALGESGRLRAQDFAWAKIAGQYQARYQAILSRHSPM